MSLPLLTILLALQFTLPSVLTSKGVTKKALQFGTTYEDYVKFSPEMSQVNGMFLGKETTPRQL